MSTISTAWRRGFSRQRARPARAGLRSPRRPFETRDAARDRQLFIIAAGPRPAVHRRQPLFDGMGQRTLVVGIRVLGTQTWSSWSAT